MVMLTRASHDAARVLEQAARHEWMRKRRRADERVAYVSVLRRETLRRCFQSIDVDHSGSIDQRELALALRALGFGSARVISLANQIMKEGDADQSGDISFEEFVNVCAKMSERLCQNDEHEVALGLGDVRPIRFDARSAHTIRCPFRPFP
eukprot:5329521-Prymnesium_polylepis.1